MEKRDSLIFYISHYQIIKHLSDEQLGKLFRGLFEKQLGNKVVLEGEVAMAFNFINNQLLVDQKKYDDILSKRSIAGKKGGAPKGNQNARKNN